MAAYGKEFLMGNDVFVSVIIPAKNEADYIRNCLDSVFGLDYPPDKFEVILVDNGSEDGTKNIASQYPVTVIDASGQRIGAVRNRGAEVAKGTILAYVDADCIVPPFWIKAALDNLAHDEIGAVGGLAEYRENPTWIERAWALRKESRRSEVKSLATGSFVIKRNIFEKVGGFKEDVVAGEDTEISRSICDAGYKLILEPKLSVVHLGYPRTVKQFVVRQIWQTSDYLKTLNSRFDKIFFLTNLFLLFIMASLVCFLLGMMLHGFVFLSTVLIIPIVVAIIKISRSIEPRSLSLFVQVFFVHVLYFAGRSLGLLNSYKKYLFG